MEPTIADGSLVLINGAAQNLVDGRIYALRAADGLRIKRIQRSMDGAVILISDNSDRYPPERLTSAEAETVLVAGHVFWTERIL
jgi:phage repressor protein C with HTH and peptisase S24 domain